MSDQKLGHEVKSWKNPVYTLEGTVLIHISWNYVRMFIFLKSRLYMKQDHAGL